MTHFLMSCKTVGIIVETINQVQTNTKTKPKATTVVAVNKKLLLRLDDDPNDVHEPCTKPSEQNTCTNASIQIWRTSRSLSCKMVSDCKVKRVVSEILNYNYYYSLTSIDVMYKKLTYPWCDFTMYVNTNNNGGVIYNATRMKDGNLWNAEFKKLISTFNNRNIYNYVFKKAYLDRVSMEWCSWYILLWACFYMKPTLKPTLRQSRTTWKTT